MKATAESDGSSDLLGAVKQVGKDKKHSPDLRSKFMVCTV